MPTAQNFQIEHQQTLCEWMRRSAPDHTYQNDAEVIASMKSLLDLNMGIPAPDARQLLQLCVRLEAGITMAQQKLIMALLVETLKYYGQTVD